MSAVSSRIEVRAPAAHEEGSRSQILRWLKAVGEPVAKDEPLIEIETDKVTVEIAAPARGVLAEILKREEEEIAPGEVLARITSDETGDGDATEPGAHPTRAAIGASTAAVGGSPPMADGSQQLAASDATLTDGDATPASADATLARVDAIPAAGDALRSRPALAPAVRRLIAELGLEADAIRGSGAGGRITVDDVLQRAAARAGAARGGDAAEADGSAAPRFGQAERRADSLPATPPEHIAPAARRVPHSATRRRIAEHMVRSLLQTAPHVTTVFEADFSAVLAHRARHRDALASAGVPLTLTAYILAACVAAVRAVPEANARWTDEALELLDPVHIGVATAVEGKGLIVPVVRHVESLDLPGTARELGRLVALAREDRLAPADVHGGTFTVSNHGVSGSLLAAPIVINQPQVAILGVGKLEKRPVVVEEASGECIVARPRAYLTLTIDHRVMDGHRANRFLEVLVHRLESWPLE